MYERVKDQRAWQLEQGRELSTLKEKVEAAQDTGVANRILDNQTALGLATLNGRVEVLERQALGARGGVPDQYTASTFRIFQANFSAVSQPGTLPVHSQFTQSCDCNVPIR